jgi:capsular polysaccharide biosynthesis protein
MSQQALDLRGPIQTVRRYKRLVGIVAVLGLLAGAAYAALHPPMVTGTALIFLPQDTQSAQAAQGGSATSNGTIDGYTSVQVVVAGSDPVLSGALQNVSPPISVTKLRGEVKVTSTTSSVISISAKGTSPAEADATANAVADSYAAYVAKKNSPVQAVARVLQWATNATGSSRLIALVSTVLIGALVGALLGVIVSLVISRKDRRLRERDDIANSIGIPVLASVPVGHPSDAAGWTRLIEDYMPAAVDSWQLRTALQQLGMTGHAFLGRPVYDGGGGFSLAVLSLSSDPRALALGPQLAVFAASHGIPTALVIGPQQDINATAALRTACAVPPSASSKRPSLLRVTFSDDGKVAGQADASLVIVVVVVDGQVPEIPATIRTTATVLGVTAGAATAEQLARAAVVAAADGREITGILVADPDSADRTNGRIPEPVQPRRRKLTTGPEGVAEGIATEIRR